MNMPSARKLWLSALVTITLVVSQARVSLGQCSFASPDCQASMSNGTSANFNALTWTHNSGPACPTGASSSYGGNLKVTMANNTNLTVTSNFTVSGDFGITNSGSNATLTVPVGVTLTIHGDLGDCTNNNVNFVINGTLIVDGYVSGKNSNGFSGTGSITATGGLYFSMAPSCSSCSITWNVGSCVPTSAFCTLPIGLILFTAESRKSSVVIHWATSSEVQVDSYVIERSSDGRNFLSLAEVKGHIDSHQRNDYTVTDERPLAGRAYYRLRENSLDGHQTYHRIVIVENSYVRQLDIYPMPVTQGMINLQTNFYTGLPSYVTVTDLTGVKLQELTIKEEEPLSFETPLRPGIYILTFVSGDFRSVKRVVVH